MVNWVKLNTKMLNMTKKIHILGEFRTKEKSEIKKKLKKEHSNYKDFSTGPLFLMI